MGEAIETLEVKLADVRVKVKPYLAKRGKKIVPNVGYTANRNAGSATPGAAVPNASATPSAPSVPPRPPTPARGTAKLTAQIKDRASKLGITPESIDTHVRRITDAIGVDPYDVDIAKLKAHAQLEERERLNIHKYFRSPCWTARKVDFSVHQVLPMMIEEKFPKEAAWLRKTSPRWGIKAKTNKKLVSETVIQRADSVLGRDANTTLSR